MTAAPARWAPDPARRAPLRFWDGGRWTAWLSDGGWAVWQDPVPISTAAPEDARARFVAETLVPTAVRRGLLSAQQVDPLIGLARELTAPGAAPTPHGWSAPAAVAAGWEPQGAGPGPAVAGPSVAGPAVPGPRTSSWSLPDGGTGPAAPVTAGPRPVRGPGPTRRALHRLGSELTVHGLAYLGVLLLFAGLFGLVAFAFGDVAPSLRPVAELGSVLVPFLAAWVLRRQGAVVVGRAMEGLGGVIAPLMVVTSLVDGFGFPPDARTTGVAPLVLAAACVLVGAAQLLWVRRHPDSGVAYAIAPTGWLAAAMATIAIGRSMPTGQTVATPTAAQVAAMALAVAATAVLTGGRPGPLRRAAGAEVLPGTVLVLVLGLVTGVAQGWPLVPVVLTLLACALAWERSAARIGGRVADSLLVAGVLLAALRVLLGPVEPRPARVVAVLATTALTAVLAHRLIRHGRSAGAALAAVLGLGAVTCGTALVLAGDRDLVAAGTWAGATALVVTGWALHVRRDAANPAALAWLAGAGQVLAVLAALLDGGGGAALLVAVALLVLAGPAGRLPHLARGADDPFWSAWWGVLGVGVVLGAAARTVVVVTGPSDTAARVSLVAALIGLLVAVLLGPFAVSWRTGLATVTGWWTWVTVAQLADVPWGWRGAGLAIAALGLALAAQLSSHAARQPDPGRGDGGPAVAGLGTAGLGTAGLGTAGLRAVALGTAAHATVVLSLPLSRHGSVPTDWAALSALWFLTAVGVDRGTGPWRRICGPLGRTAGPTAWAGGLLALAVAVSATADVAGVIPFTGPWRGLPPAVLAVAYAIATRFLSAPATDRPSRTAAAVVLAPVGTALALLATLLAHGIGSLALGLGALVAVPVLVRPGRRPAVAVWTAWTVLPAFGWAVTRALHPAGWWAEPWPLVALALIVAGGATVVGTLVVDSPRPVRRRPPGRAALPAMAAGSTHLALGTGVAVLGGCLDPSSGWAALIGVASAFVLAVGVLTLLAPLAAAALVLVWVGSQVLLGGPLDPAVQLVLVATVLVLAHLVSRRPHSGWTRPDAWLALTAVPAHLVGLTLALDQASRAPDDPGPQLAVAAGGLALIASAGRLRRRRTLAELLGWAGTAVLLLGSALAGAGWPTLTLALTAAAHTALAAFVSRGTARAVRQVVGAVAAIAAWACALAWLSPGLAAGTDLTLGLGAGILVLLAALVNRRGIDRSWVVVWGTAAGILGLVAIGPVLAGTAPADGWQVAALVAAAGALVVLDRRHGPDLGAVLLLAATQIGLLAAGTGHGPAIGVLVGASAAAAVSQVLTRAVPTARRAVTELGYGLLVLAAVQAALVAGDSSGASTSAGSAAVPAAAVLAGLAVQSAATGVAWGALGLRLAAPVLGWSAWAVLVAHGLAGTGVGWYTVPLGAALLGVVGLWRLDLRRRGLAVNPPGLGALEVSGLGFCVLTSFVDAFTAGVLHALLVSGAGVAALLWGLVSHVRRRLYTGAVLTLAGLVVAVALPLVGILPPWGGAAAWLTLAGVGLLAVGAATLIEKGRTAARTARARLRSMTAGWE
ncbi:MAG: hypothetical protein L6311_08880 [Cellulomonas sp.]|nr:hypothetical protein [Cellulomonas sp.]